MLFRNYLPLERPGQTRNPFDKGCLCQVWLKLAQWFWRRRFLNFDNVFLLFRNYLPLEKHGALPIYILVDIPLTKRDTLFSKEPTMLCTRQTFIPASSRSGRMLWMTRKASFTMADWGRGVSSLDHRLGAPDQSQTFAS